MDHAGIGSLFPVLFKQGGASFSLNHEYFSINHPYREML